MTGSDWLFVLGVIAFLVLVFTLDDIRRLDDRDDRRLRQRKHDDDYRRERQRLP